MSLKNFFFPDGIVPFPIRERNEEGKAFEQWDGSTVYKDPNLTWGVMEGNQSGFVGPSAKADRLVTVYGEGSIYWLKLTGRQVSELYWRWAEYKIDFDPISLDGFSASAAAGSTSVNVQPDVLTVTANDIFNGKTLGRKKNYVFTPSKADFEFIDFNEPDLVVGQVGPWLVDNGQYSDGGYYSSLQVFPGSNADADGFADSAASIYIRLGIGQSRDHLVSDSSVIKTGPDEYWASVPSLWSYALYDAEATAEVYEVSVNSAPAWQVLRKRGILVNGQILNTSDFVGDIALYISFLKSGLWEDQENVQSGSIRGEVQFSDGSVASGSSWALLSTFLSTEGPGGVSTNISTPNSGDYLSVLKLKPTGFFTYDGAYDETTGLKL